MYMCEHKLKCEYRRRGKEWQRARWSPWKEKKKAKLGACGNPLANEGLVSAV